MKETDIAGYVLAEHAYCPICIHDLFIPFELIGGKSHSTEEILDLVAKRRGIDRHDESFVQLLRVSETDLPGRRVRRRLLRVVRATAGRPR